MARLSAPLPGLLHKFSGYKFCLLVPRTSRQLSRPDSSTYLHCPLAASILLVVILFPEMHPVFRSCDADNVSYNLILVHAGAHAGVCRTPTIYLVHVSQRLDPSAVFKTLRTPFELSAS